MRVLIKSMYVSMYFPLYSLAYLHGHITLTINLDFKIGPLSFTFQSSILQIPFHYHSFSCIKKCWSLKMEWSCGRGGRHATKFWKLISECWTLWRRWKRTEMYDTLLYLRKPIHQNRIEILKPRYHIKSTQYTLRSDWY